jgi:hypothetical protein
MGMTRKTMSLLTLGLIDFRSDKERAAAYGRGTKKAAKKSAREAKRQRELLEQIARQQRG